MAVYVQGTSLTLGAIHDGAGRLPERARSAPSRGSGEHAGFDARPPPPPGPGAPFDDRSRRADGDPVVPVASPTAHDVPPGRSDPARTPRLPAGRHDPGSTSAQRRTP